MENLYKLTGGRRCFQINPGDTWPEGKKAFLIVPAIDTVFTTLSADSTNEKTARGFTAAFKVSAPINANGGAYFTNAVISAGQLICYEPNS